MHYLAATAAIELKDFDTVERELTFFVSEDPTSALAPVARQNLATLAKNKNLRAAIANSPMQATNVSAPQPLQTFPNSDRLKAQLSALDEDSKLPTVDSATETVNASAPSDLSPGLPSRPTGVYTLRRSVD